MILSHYIKSVLFSYIWYFIKVSTGENANPWQCLSINIRVGVEMGFW